MSVIDPAVRTSRVFDATLKVFDLIDAITFPEHPVTNISPDVHLFSDPTWEEGEHISVLLNEDPAVHEWVSSSPASGEESIVIDVLIRSSVSGLEERAVVERLWELADPVQLIAYDVSAGKPKAIGFRNENRTGRARDVSFGLQRTKEGLVGFGLVRFALSAQI